MMNKFNDQFNDVFLFYYFQLRIEAFSEQFKIKIVDLSGYFESQKLCQPVFSKYELHLVF